MRSTTGSAGTCAAASARPFLTRSRRPATAAGDRPGRGFAELHRLVGGEVLAENRRQRHAGERAALQVRRTGAREDALRMLAGPERVHATATADQARTAILAAWDAVRTRWDDVHDQVAEF